MYVSIVEIKKNATYLYHVYFIRQVLHIMGEFRTLNWAKIGRNLEIMKFVSV